MTFDFSKEWSTENVTVKRVTKISLKNSLNMWNSLTGSADRIKLITIYSRISNSTLESIKLRYFFLFSKFLYRGH